MSAYETPLYSELYRRFKEEVLKLSSTSLIVTEKTLDDLVYSLMYQIRSDDDSYNYKEFNEDFDRLSQYMYLSSVCTGHFCDELELKQFEYVGSGLGNISYQRFRSLLEELIQKDSYAKYLLIQRGYWIYIDRTLATILKLTM